MVTKVTSYEEAPTPIQGTNEEGVTDCFYLSRGNSIRMENITNLDELDDSHKIRLEEIDTSTE